MSFQTGYIALNSQPTNWQQTLTDFQVEDCAGSPIGDPVAAMQAIVLNKLLVSVCNINELAGAIGTSIANAQPAYNTPGRLVLEDGETVTLAANTYNAVAFKVIQGEGTIAIGTGDPQAIGAGEADSWGATKKLDKSFTITCGTGKIVVTTIS